MSWIPLAGILPWVGLGIFMAFGIREPRPLPGRPDDTAGDGTDPAPDSAQADPSDERPLVSIIVPARNEARSIGRCVSSLAAQEGVRFEIVVVDDRSTDETAQIVRSIPPGRAERIRVVEGSPLPEGWFGKPWACRQGADEAQGELLLFTDADTTHHPELLARSLAALDEDHAAALSLLGRQEMVTLAERLVQPQVLTLIGLRYRGLDRVVERRQDAIANGQYVLVRREAYRSIGGHDAVRGDVVEDLRLAQELVGAGHRLTMRQGEDVFSTRMYTSLSELVDGWTKNVAVGARQSAGWWSALALPGIVGFLLLAWLAPVVGLLAGVGAWAFGAAAAPGLVWAGVTTLFAVFIWMGAYARFGVSPLYGLLYPLGTLVVLYIVLRSWLRGSRRIEWKGRRYERGSSARG